MTPQFETTLKSTLLMLLILVAVYFPSPVIAV